MVSWIYFSPIALLLVPLAALYYAMILPPQNNPRAFKKDPSKRTICFIGDSYSHGHMSSNYVRNVVESLDPSEWQYMNAGYNGYLTIDILGRLDPIISAQPDVVTIFLGANDLHGCIEGREKLYTTSKYFPKGIDPLEFWNSTRFKRDYQRIVETLIAETQARIILITLPPISEVKGSKPYELSEEYSEIIRKIGAQLDIEVIDLHKSMIDMLAESPSTPKYPFMKNLNLMYKASLQRYLLRRSWNQIAEMNGFTLLTDHIHLNDTAADMLAQSIGEKL